MSKLVYYNVDGKKTSEGAEDSAFQFHEGDERIDRFVAARKASATGRPAPAAAADEDDGSVETVGVGRKK